MDRTLLDKEVLCIIDTRQIQRYIFHSNSLRDAVGGGMLIAHILPDALLNAISTVTPQLRPEEYDLRTDPEAEIPYFTDRGIQFQLMTCAAGNAMFLVRTGELAGKLIRKIARYYLDHAYSLNLTAAAVEKTDSLADDVFRLYQKLNALKASAEIQEPLGTLPVCISERKTGDPVVDRDAESGEYISQASALRRAESRRRTNVPDMGAIRTTEGKNGGKYRAVIHADGNNIGITIGRILAGAASYEEGIRTRRKINREIEQNYAEIVERTLGDLKRYCAEDLGGDDLLFEDEFQIVNRAGDDINCICNAKLAFPFLVFFFNNMKGSVIWQSEELTVPLYDCAGIAFVPETADFHTAFELAEACCSNAKKTAKLKENLRDGLAGNWIDFYVSDEESAPDLDVLRETYFVTKEGTRLLVRPYSLDPEAVDSFVSFRTLLEHIRKYETLAPDLKREAMHAYVMEPPEFLRWLQSWEKKGVDLSGRLGAPFCDDNEKKRYFTWYDPAVLSDFVPADLGRYLI